MKVNFNTHKPKLTLGQRASDRLTSTMGSWGFIIIFLVFLVIWMIFNAYILVQYNSGKAFDSGIR